MCKHINKNGQYHAFWKDGYSAKAMNKDDGRGDY